MRKLLGRNAHYHDCGDGLVGVHMLHSLLGTLERPLTPSQKDPGDNLKEPPFTNMQWFETHQKCFLKKIFK